MKRPRGEIELQYFRVKDGGININNFARTWTYARIILGKLKYMDKYLKTVYLTKTQEETDSLNSSLSKFTHNHFKVTNV